jgi:hypothetical protein
MNFKETKSGLLIPDVKLLVGGRFTGQIIRDGEVIDEIDDQNLVVNEGLNYLLNVALAGQGQLNTWFVGLFSGNYTPQASDTAANITANATEWTGYGEATRQAFSTVATTTQSITNSASTATFTQNTAGTVYGAFIISSSQKSGITGTLLAAAQFSSPKTVAVGDLLALTYTVGASSQ